MAFCFRVAETFERSKCLPDFLVKSVDCMFQLGLYCAGKFLPFAVHLVAIFPQNFSASPNGVNCSCDSRYAHHSTCNVYDCRVTERSDDCRHTARSDNRSRQAKPTRGLAEQTLQLLPDPGI